MYTQAVTYLEPLRWNGIPPAVRPLETAMTRTAMKHKPETKPDPTHEDLLMDVGKDRDRKAFAALFQYFAPRIKSFLMRLGSDDSEAEELAQAVMLTVWQKAASYDPSKAAASTWIFTIARNRRIDLLRKHKRPEINPDDPALVPDDRGDAHDILVRADTAKALTAAIRDLPKEQSDLIYKSYFEDKSHSQIADETDLPLGTVKSRLRLALNALRKKIGKEIPA